MIDEKKLKDDVKKYFAKLKAHNVHNLVELFFGDIIDIIEEQPKLSLETKTSDKWIPCSDRLPEVNKKVLVTYEKLNRGTLLVGFDKRVIRRGLEMWQGKGNSVLAWYDPPLPEPYKGE